MSLEKSVYLFKTEGSADKEYHLHLRQKGEAWVVDYANGRRGKVCGSKPVTDEPVSFEEATKIFQAKLKSKTKDGYTESQTGVRFTNTEFANRASLHVQQLPTPINLEQAESLLENPDWVVQEKANGERRSVVFSENELRGVNKLGLFVNIPEPWVHEFETLGNPEFDGEQVGETLYVFDLIASEGKSIKGLPFEERYALLESLLTSKGEQCPSIKLLKAYSGSEKRNFLQTIEDDRREGIVFKNIHAPYDGGRSIASYKYKLFESATCIVLERNKQRSVQLGLLSPSGAIVHVGNVTIPSNHGVPAENALVEVEYLYYNPEGSFEQPVYLGERNDILFEEALLSQVSRLKPGVEMDDSGRRIAAIERQRG